MGNTGAATTVVLIDDHTVVADALSVALAAEGISVVGKADTLGAGVEQVAELRPDVVLLDFRLPDADGIAGVIAVEEAAPGTPVLVLTGVTDARSAAGVLQAGACGYLTKDTPIGELVDAILKTARGEATVSPAVLSGVLEAMRAPQQRRAEGLTPRELEALGHLEGGLPVNQVAAVMGVSRNTARKHVQSVLQKLGAHTQLEAVAIARREGVLEADG